MIGSTSKIPTVKGLSTLVRPRFGPGMLLQHDDLDLLTDYTRELNRLLFRSLFGCGVICGLEVNYKENCGLETITVDAGIGLVCSGDPVYVPRQQTVILEARSAEMRITEIESNLPFVTLQYEPEGPAKRVRIDVGLDPKELTAGEHSGTVRIHTSSEAVPFVTLPIKMTVAN